MAITNQTFEMFAGEDRVLNFTVTDEDALVAGSPKSLTGLTLRFTLCKISASTGSVLYKTPLVEKTSTNAAEILITDSLNGLVEVYLVGADTVDLIGEYYFELDCIDVGNRNVVLGTGRVTINFNVKNAP